MTGTPKPAVRSPSTRTSRRAAKAWRRCSTVAHTSGEKAARPPYWAGAGAAMKAFWASDSIARRAHSGQTIQPRRQPVMPNVLEKLLITKAVPDSFDPGEARTVAGARS